MGWPIMVTVEGNLGEGGSLFYSCTLVLRIELGPFLRKIVKHRQLSTPSGTPGG